MTGAFSWLFGCARPTTFDDVIQGETALVPSDREAVTRLLAASSATPADVLLLAPDESYGPEPNLKIEEGPDGYRVTRLALAGLRDTSGLDGLQALVDLRLSGSFDSLRLTGLESLEELSVLSEDESLEALELEDLPALRRLSVHGANLPDELDLTGLQLQTLSLTHCGLETAPPLDPAALTDLFLSGNPLGSLDFLTGFGRLERLHLAKIGLESLDGLPRLPALKALYVGDNPLRPDVSLDADRVPKLIKIDLARTGLRAAPLGMRDRETLRVEFEPGVAEAMDFQAMLASLRTAQKDSPGDLVTKVRNTSGTIRGSSGRCTWKTSTLRRAEVSCRFTYESLRGTALASLGETDPAMPFRGGGPPRVRVTLTVGEGSVALYVRHRHDHLATAQLLTDASDELVEAAGQSGDLFEGYRRVVARPGEPAIVQGDVLLLGSRVALIVESVDDEGLDTEARDIELVVEPA